MSAPKDDAPPESESSESADPLPAPPVVATPSDSLNIVLGELLETGQIELPAELLEEGTAGRTTPFAAASPAPEIDEDAFAADEQTGEYAVQASGGRLADDVGEESHVIGERYRLEEGLAMGGMGAVFKVTHLELGKTFALKIIHPGLASRSSAQKSFMREAQVLSRLEHRNIVQVTDFGADDKFGAYLVMEYLKGESLQSRLKQHRVLPLSEALAIGLQVAEALEHMHAQQLIHCDIKTENVFICRKQSASAPVQAKLIDFGLSKNMAHGMVKLSKSEIAGTPAYIAPEQARGGAPQPSNDVYAVGTLLYEMITGVLPFVGPAKKVLVEKCSSPAPPPSRHLSSPLDPTVEALIQRALAMDPQERHPTMADLVADLRRVLYELAPEALRATSGEMPATTSPDGLRRPADHRWDRCRIPVFFVDRDGRLRLTCAAFDQLVRRQAGAVLGMTPGETVLGNIYQYIDADIAGALESNSPRQRRIDFTEADGADASILIWLVPETDEQGRVQGVWGTLVPVARA